MGLTLISPSSAEQQYTKQLQLVEIDEMPLPWGQREAEAKGTADIVAMYTNLSTVGRETFS